MLVGGEAIPLALWEKLAAHPGIHFHNLYGPTECTVDATTCCVSDTGPVPVIGRPISNAQVHVLDSQGALVPVGVPGEIHIGGVGVGRGYLNQPELTAERFIPDPFSSEAEARLYKSGDIGRWRADGVVEFLGRCDSQVKIRGFRIELGEVESALAGCAGVREAIVVAREDDSGDKRLVAYVVAHESHALGAADLRAQLQETLPAYMVPASFVTLETLPLNANGKVDRGALPLPDANRAALDTAYVAPRTATEELLAGIWAEVLGIDRVGIHDNFFELGGHSLLAVRLAQRLRDVIGSKVPIASIFRAPTVGLLASEIESNRHLIGRGALTVIRRGTEELAPLHLVHDFTGLVNCYHRLSQLLDPRRDVYAFEANPLVSTRASTVESIASHYLESIDLSNRSRPLILGGYSFGALVALEMMRKLREMDVVLAPLILIAPPLDVLRRTPPSKTDESSAEEEALSALKEVFQVGNDVPGEYGIVKSMAVGHIAASRRYEPTFLEIECVLIQPDAEDGTGGDWPSLCRRLEYLTIPGDHHSIFQSQRLPGLAAVLNSIMRKFK